MTDSPGPAVPAPTAATAPAAPQAATDDGGVGPASTPVVLPGRAALFGLGGFVVGAAGGIGLALAGRALGLPSIVVLLLNLVGLWFGLLGACRMASRRYGTGRVLADFGVRIDGADVGRGILMSLAARFAGAAVLIPFLATSRRTVGSNTEVYGKVATSPAAYVAFGVVAVVGAPLVEELFFRGLLLRSLTTRIGARAALIVQAVLFGLAHFSPLLGLANLSVMAVIATAGVVFGLTARRWRVGTSVIAHGTFNLISVIAAAFVLFG